MAFSEILFLNVAFTRPLHPSDLEGPEAKVTPKPEMGLRTTNSRDRSKEDRFSTDPVHTICTLTLKHTSKSFNETLNGRRYIHQL